MKPVGIFIIIMVLKISHIIHNCDIVHIEVKMGKLAMLNVWYCPLFWHSAHWNKDENTRNRSISKQSPLSFSSLGPSSIRTSISPSGCSAVISLFRRGGRSSTRLLPSLCAVVEHHLLMTHALQRQKMFQTSPPQTSKHIHPSGAQRRVDQTHETINCLGDKRMAPLLVRPRILVENCTDQLMARLARASVLRADIRQ